jgi:hypothetical protein
MEVRRGERGMGINTRCLIFALGCTVNKEKNK